MKTKLFSFFILVLSLLTLSCGTEKSKYDYIIGKQYRSLTEFPEIEPLARGGGTLMGKVKKVDYVLSYYRNDTSNVIAFEKISKKVKGQSRFRLIDILEVNNLPENQFITFGTCRLNQEEDKEIIAIYQNLPIDAAQDTIPEVEYYVDIIRAWRANRETKQIEPIDVENIDCRNKVFGM